MDNRPIALKEPIIAFKNSDLTIKLNYPEGYTMPAEIEMELWVGSIKAQIESPVIAEITGESAEISVDRSVVKTLPSQADAYFLHDGNFLFGAKFFVQSGLAENTDPIEMNVSFNGDQVIVVEVLGLDLISQQVTIATEKAEQTAADALNTAADRVQTGQDAATTTQKAQEAAGSATIALDAKEETLQARDQVIGPLATKMDLYKADTFAAMQQFIVDEQPEACMFLVLADETYSGLPRFHGYTKLPANPIVQLVSY